MPSVATLPDINELLLRVTSRLSDDEITAAQDNSARFRETMGPIANFKMFAEEPSHR